MASIITESGIEENVLQKLRQNGYSILFGPDIAPDGKTPERKSYSEVVLIERLNDAIDRSNPAIPGDAKEEAVKKAISWIKNITREVKVGEIFQGKVKRILDFGAFVEILPGQEGLIHISQLAPYRVEKVEDVVKVGEILPVKVISIDEQGRINLSLKEAKKGYAPRK